MKKQQRRTAQGFTIIEVVLVLAIAGLIFLMVFVALPGLQRSQRDTQRRNDYAMLATNVTNYMTNHNGKLPTKCGNNADSKFKTDQLNDQIGEDGTTKGTDPDGMVYELKCVDGVDNIDDGDKQAMEREQSPVVYVVSHATCDENGEPDDATSKRSFIVFGQLESGTYCNASS